MPTLTTPGGAALAYQKAGSGPPVVLVAGALSDRTAWDALLPLLTPYATTYALDRRGRGDSADRPGSTVADEIADVRALLAEAGPGAVLLGHSSGALLALRAAAGTRGVRAVVAYEPPPYPADGPPARRLREHVDAGDPEAALTVFLRVLLGDASPPHMAARSEEVAARVPGARLDLLPGQRHDALAEAPELLARHVRGVL